MNNNGEKLWWVGTRLADLYGCENSFTGAIVVSGGVVPSGLQVICLEEKTGVRLNHNDKKNGSILQRFFSESVEFVRKNDPSARFVFYSCPDKLLHSVTPERIYYNNPPGLFDLCNDKERFRRIVREQGIATLQDKILPGDALDKLESYEYFSNSSRFVAQERVGFGGHQTFVLPQGRHHLRPDLCYLVSPFIEGSIPVNVHLVIFADRPPQVFPGSVQLVEDVDSRLLYMGGDYGLYNRLTSAERKACHDMAIRCGEILQHLGYRGVAGIDLLLDTDGNAVFLELNPRFQSSTPALNNALAKVGAMTVMAAHLAAFRPDEPASADTSLPVEVSFFAPLMLDEQNSPELPDGELLYDLDDTRTSAFSPAGVAAHVYGKPPYPLVQREKDCNLARIHFTTSIAAIDNSRKICVQPAIRDVGRHTNEFNDLRREQISRIAWLKFKLLSLGMRLSPSARKNILETSGRLTVRDGIAGGIEMRLFDDIYINVPVKENFVAFSPFELHVENGGFVLLQNATLIAGVTLPSQHLFWGQMFGDGDGLNTIGHVNTDRLGLYPFRSCKYTHKKGAACKFCEIGYMPPYAKVPTADAIALVKRCELELPQVRHVLISGGVGPDSNWKYYPEFASDIRSVTQMPIYMMIEPPANPGLLSLLHQAGVDEVGINMEVFDPRLAAEIMPGKGAIPRTKYFDTLERAVALWGGHGAVRSIMMVGLERIENTLRGIEALASRNVMPILSPFRPVPGTGLANIPVPDPSDMQRVWERGQDICQRYGMTLGPLCVACQNNTLALPVNDSYRHY